jgi:hypothetical protein
LLTYASFKYCLDGLPLFIRLPRSAEAALTVLNIFQQAIVGRLEQLPNQ